MNQPNIENTEAGFYERSTGRNIVSPLDFSTPEKIKKEITDKGLIVTVENIRCLVEQCYEKTTAERASLNIFC